MAKSHEQSCGQHDNHANKRDKYNVSPSRVDVRDEASLMQAIAEGDEAAFRHVLDSHVDPLYNYALRLCHSRSQAEDLLQETWLQVWRKAGSFNPRKASLSTWLHRVLHNKHIDATRRHRELQVEIQAEVPQKDNAPEAAKEATIEVLQHDPEHLSMIVQSRQMALFDQALAKLPLEQKSALLLSQVHGFSNPEVGHILGKGVRAVESLISRARRSLGSALQSGEGEGSGKPT